MADTGLSYRAAFARPLRGDRRMGAGKKRRIRSGQARKGRNRPAVLKIFPRLTPPGSPAVHARSRWLADHALPRDTATVARRSSGARCVLTGVVKPRPRRRNSPVHGRRNVAPGFQAVSDARSVAVTGGLAHSAPSHGRQSIALLSISAEEADSSSEIYAAPVRGRCGLARRMASHRYRSYLWRRRAFLCSRDEGASAGGGLSRRSVAREDIHFRRRVTLKSDGAAFNGKRQTMPRAPGAGSDVPAGGGR